ncbi:MAG: penicillin acylase family protein, partial [Desulfatibacillaceae bacterium]|nr:penicillin acylase family protein [Desulfatibacillaceae bacterium]
SEMLGDQALDVDIFVRAMNLKQRAENAYDLASLELKEMAQAYARGVNAYIWTHQGKLPMDLTLSGYRPDPWRAVDCFYAMQFFSFGLSGNLYQEAAFLHVATKVGLEKAAWLAPVYPDEALPFDEAAKLGSADLEEGRDAVETLARLQHKARAYLGGFSPASNNWALSGARTASSRVILANDIHQPIALPSLWSISHIRAPGRYDAAGFSVAGIPGILIGFNGSVAWGMTQAMADTQDLFLEKLSLIDGKLHYLHQDRWVPTRERTETFRVSGGLVKTLVIHETLHGVLVYPALAEKPLGHLMGSSAVFMGIAAGWAEPVNDLTLDGFFALARAADIKEASLAVEKIQSINANFIFADKTDIAWKVTGIYPLRKKGTGLLPSPGWNGAYDWAGLVAQDELPEMVNPANGFLATANARITDRAYPFVLSQSWANPARHNRLHRVLAEHSGHNLLSTFALAQERVSSLVTAVQRIYLNSVYTDPIRLEIAGWASAAKKQAARQALAMLRKSTPDISENSVDEIIVPAIVHCFTLNTFADELDGPDSALWNSFLALGRASYAAWDDHLFVQDDQSPFFNLVSTKDIQTKAWVLAKSLVDAVSLLDARLGMENKSRTMGDLSQYYFETLSSRISTHMPVLRRMGARLASGYYNAGPFPAGGDYTTINVNGFTPGEGFDPWYIPSMRMVVDFSADEPLFVVNSTGQSGNPASPHYTDGIRAWLDGSYMNMPFGADKISARYTSVLMLEPKIP